MDVVRRFEPEDAAVCCEVINAAIEAMDGLNAAARSLIASKNLRDVLAADFARSFAVVAVGPAGVEGVGVLDGAEVKRVYVHPRAQRRGLGTQVVRALEAEARKAGLGRVELQASPSSVGFYLYVGFQEMGQETSRNGDAEFIHIRMFKDLG